MKKISELLIEGKTITLTHTDKILFPKDNISKQDLIEYYYNVSKTMLPYITGRPLMMQRFLQGIDSEGFYQKEAGEYFPKWIDRFSMKKLEGGINNFVIANNTASLVYLAEQDCITPHVWLSTIDHPNNPDLMVFDLDPSDSDFEQIRKAATALRDLLSKLGISSMVKTTGSRGLHVVVRLDKSADFQHSRSFAQRIAEFLAEQDPEHLTVEQRKDKRKGRVFIDTMRNNYGQTAVAPYAIRALPGAPIATPLAWEELKTSRINPQSFTIGNIFKRLGLKGDPWKKSWQQTNSLAGLSQKIEGLKTAV